MVGRDTVSEDAQRARRFNLADLARLQTKIREERRFLNVGAFCIPLINVACSGGDFVPLGVLLGKIAVKLAKDFGFQGSLHRITDLLRARPDVLQVNILTLLSLSKR